MEVLEYNKSLYVFIPYWLLLLLGSASHPFNIWYG